MAPAAENFAVRTVTEALIEHWLDTATGNCSDESALFDLSDGDHAYMISAAHQFLDQRRAAGIAPDRLRDLEYGYLHRSVESYERMMVNPVFMRGSNGRMQENLNAVRAQIAERDAASVGQLAE